MKLLLAINFLGGSDKTRFNQSGLLSFGLVTLKMGNKNFNYCMILLLIGFLAFLTEENLATGSGKKSKGLGSLFKKKKQSTDFFPKMQCPFERKALNKLVTAIVYAEDIFSETYEVTTPNYMLLFEVSVTSCPLHLMDAMTLERLTNALLTDLQSAKDEAKIKPDRPVYRMSVIDNGGRGLQRFRVVIKLSLLQNSSWKEGSKNRTASTD